ncbi:MAG: pyridoxal phosphate-dependent aminotransferase, partial [Clostridia bacterium]|nr:pyridoxal phosphate-dependent aminotransferase [Clostridia bacterium]
MKLSKIALKVRPSQTLSISAKANIKKFEGVDVINFSAGEPDFNTPYNVKEAAISAINENFTKYTPYEGIEELREAVADAFERRGLKYSPDQIVVSNGSKHALKNTFSAIIDPGDEVIVPAPYWNSYIDIINMVYGVPVVVETKKENVFKINVEELEEVYTDKTKAIIINSPNNPTGVMYTKEELEKIAEFAVEKDIYVISDEVYSSLVYSRKTPHISIASLGKEIYERTIVIDGLSKKYAMTGWRVGFSASNKEVAEAIGNIQSNSTSNINSIAQAAAIEALDNSEEVAEEMLKEFQHRRDYIAQRVSDIPLISCMLPKGAFYLFVDISKLLGTEIDGVVLESSVDVANILMDKYNVAVVP